MKIVCFDAASDTLAGIAAGDIYGTIVQMPYNFGYQTILRMEKYLHGDKTQLAEGKILLPSRALTKDKVERISSLAKNLAPQVKGRTKVRRLAGDWSPVLAFRRPSSDGSYKFCSTNLATSSATRSTASVVVPEKTVPLEDLPTMSPEPISFPVAGSLNSTLASVRA